MHQIGHNFAAIHSFDKDINGDITAQYGGIMDYATSANAGDVTYDGIIQFNHELWKHVICENLAYVSFFLPILSFFFFFFFFF